MEITRLFDILDNYLEQHPNQEAALACKRDGEWRKFSIQEYTKLTDYISYGLIKLGIKKGDKVGIVSGNRPEWNMIDFAAMQIGAISVPIYPNISTDDYKHILNHAEMSIIFVEGQSLREKLTPIMEEVQSLKHIYTFVKQNDEVPYLDQLIELGKEYSEPRKLAEIKKSIDKMEMATIIYTSGSTGVQKGVMLSHDNIVQNFSRINHIPAKWSHTALSFLPLCHAYERMLVYLYQSLGMSVYYAESLATIAQNIKEINPTMMTCVPRLLEKIYDKLWVSGLNFGFIQKNIYYWAFKLAKRYKVEHRTWFYNIEHAIADKLIYSKWRKAIGGNFDIVVSGGSAIQKEQAAFFSAIGMPVFEGYGLSETSPVIAVMNRGKGGRKFGTVGHVMPGTEMQIGENNEILCRGHNVMLGYYKDPELTKQVIDENGWFHTGDTGSISKNGVLTITGRLKSLFKTSFGKYVNPEVIEAKFAESKFIENVMVVGENQKYAGALISPDMEYLKSWCNLHNIEFTTPEEIIENQVVKDRITKDIKKYNEDFAGYEQVKVWKLVAEPWSMANNFLTPTLKMKRKNIAVFYKNVIEALFK
ncbi:MAG: long-chain fatty acid--CoA ligase [Bacteroidales bacterium]|jgi:long-chain acyl-CoA synthetase|nr:long-chain fatty acid--CoA ligase [Bacteroidales bacterium]